ncbi:Hsp33 family molecular chaperone HslO [Deinococcus deserti]|uniref:33 kDa chaperonin n=1 Tax=Deinococcus deserti (strain DSM 17065 / CIP 109153 / LMG 22923 / VCD115) TaxID=546414 RepID=C1D0U6_DEIDV|nr:Hsp33 family molecular chaperone HslO [Deinococcus deserti]ACO45470.1 putative heat shock protein 33 (HSP33) (33 kDa chaperonin) [Deinococcus deserti VCD115]
MTDAIPASFVLRGTAAENTLRLVGMDATRIVEDARLRHGLSKTATAVLGRTMTASALLATVLGKRSDSRVTVRVHGGGPVGLVVAEGSVDGRIRGYVGHPDADLPLRESDGKLDVSGLVGTDGELEVTRLLDNGEPYTGSVHLISGEIAEDVSTYLGVSEQIPNAALLGVYEEGGRVHRAGGVLIQAMPGVSDETLARLEANIRAFGQITDHLRRGSLMEAMTVLTEGLNLTLAPEAQPAAFQCRCTRERASDSLRFFNAEERQEMIDAGGQGVHCHWCSETYHITPAEIAALDAQIERARA